MYLEIKGNLLDYSETHYLVHQCNCKTTNCLGLAKVIFTKYPDANTYNNNSIRVPSNIDIIKPIINLYGQIFPGKAKPVLNDSKQHRLEYFKNGLQNIYNELNENENENENINLAFPKNIGCGLAGGVWTDYKSILKQFEKNYENINILIVDFA